jgi:hypothetical protein
MTEIQFSESAVILLNGQMNQALFSLDGQEITTGKLQYILAV